MRFKYMRVKFRKNEVKKVILINIRLKNIKIRLKHMRANIKNVKS